MYIFNTDKKKKETSQLNVNQVYKNPNLKLKNLLEN